MTKKLINTWLTVCLVLTMTFALLAACNDRDKPPLIQHPGGSSTPVLPVRIAEYDIYIWSQNGFRSTGNLVDDLNITVMAGDIIYVNVVIDHIQYDMFDIWFELEHVDLGDPKVTADYLGQSYIRCNEVSKWLTLPEGLTGSVSIGFTDKTGKYEKSIPAILSVTVISATND